MRPNSVWPATNGPSNATPNHVPNSPALLTASHTRSSGAASWTCFSMRSGDWVIAFSLRVSIIDGMPRVAALRCEPGPWRERSGVSR